MNRETANLNIAVVLVFLALGALITVLVGMTKASTQEPVKTEILDITEVPPQYHPTDEEIEDAILEDMAKAFAIVESGNKCNKHNLPEDAMGCLQIRKIMVDEANNILGEQFFSYEDRWDRSMSFYMFEVVMRKKNPELDIDQACDIWNPNCPQSYRQKVKDAYCQVMAESLETRGY